MDQSQKAAEFRKLHQKGNPLVLYNVWDAGSAKAVADAGAMALATGSASVAAAQGFADGEKIPLALSCKIVSHIVAATDLPVTMDFEGGYATAPDAITKNVGQLLQTGAIGLNFEDQILGKDGLYTTETQGARIAAVRAASPDLFINSRTDLFLQEPDKTKHANLIDEAISRAQIYHASGADGFFVPGLVDIKLIAVLCETLPIPVNIMKTPDAPTNAALTSLGVSRISYGPFPYFAAMATLSEQAQTL